MIFKALRWTASKRSVWDLFRVGCHRGVLSYHQWWESLSCTYQHKWNADHRFIFTRININNEHVTHTFLLKNLHTHKSNTFTVWCQQVGVKLVRHSKALWTVSTWVWLCTSVNTNMSFQITVCLKRLPTVRTLIWSNVAVYNTVMSIQVAGVTETSVTQWTLVWFVSCVDSHVSFQMSRLTKHLVTYVTFVWFLSTVNSAVINKTFSPCESFATNTTFKRFLSRMNLSVFC